MCNFDHYEIPGILSSNENTLNNIRYNSLLPGTKEFDMVMVLDNLNNICYSTNREIKNIQIENSSYNSAESAMIAGLELRIKHVETILERLLDNHYPEISLSLISSSKVNS